MTLTYYTIQARKENYKFSSLQNFKVGFDFCKYCMINFFGMELRFMEAWKFFYPGLLNLFICTKFHMTISFSPYSVDPGTLDDVQHWEDLRPYNHLSYPF